MKHAAGIVLLVGLCALPAHGGSSQLSTNVLHAMTPIGSVPTKAEIEDIFPTNTVGALTAIAGNVDEDFGVRLRAIRALPEFCLPSCVGTPAHAALVALLSSVVDPNENGKTNLLLRATIEAIGAAKSGDNDDVMRIAGYLENVSRDLRAATAFALRDLCLQSAVTPLRRRYDVETVPQVRLAISAALRDLNTCSN